MGYQTSFLFVDSIPSWRMLGRVYWSHGRSPCSCHTCNWTWSHWKIGLTRWKGRWRRRSTTCPRLARRTRSLLSCIRKRSRKDSDEMRILVNGIKWKNPILFEWKQNDNNSTAKADAYMIDTYFVRDLCTTFIWWRGTCRIESIISKNWSEYTVSIWREK